MSSAPLHVSLVAPFPIDDVVAVVSRAGGGTSEIVIRAGHFVGTMAEAPTHLRLTWQTPPTADPAGAAIEPATMTAPPQIVEAEELFERGVPIPPGGELHLQLIWGIHCHKKADALSHAAVLAGEKSTENQLFLAPEHIECAKLVGLAEDESPLTFQGMGFPFEFFYATKLPIGRGKEADFGSIIALAGDFYAHLDATALADFALAWDAAPIPLMLFCGGDYRNVTLLEDDQGPVKDTLERFERERRQLMQGQEVTSDSNRQLLADMRKTDTPIRRYLTMAAVNHCHFSAQPPDGKPHDDRNEALSLYRLYHERALREAEAAGKTSDAAAREAQLRAALVVDAFGCHFLTDMFASGHMRVPRRKLFTEFHTLRGSKGMAHAMHDEDNRLGLWCTTRHPQTPRLVWRAYGDGQLPLVADDHKDGRSTRTQRPDLFMVQQSVRRSVAELLSGYLGLGRLPPAETAEALLPVALPPGHAPRATDVLPGTTRQPEPNSVPNHFPLFCDFPERPLHQQVARRVGPPEQNKYTIQDGPRGTFAITVPPPEA